MHYNILTRNSLWAILMTTVCLSSCNNILSPGNAKESDASGEHGKPVPIIFDTDIGGDYDDVGALGMLHALADRGEVKILATVASNLSPLVVPSISVINTYFGRPDLPIGAPKTQGVTQDSRELHWPDSLIAHYPYTYQSTGEAPDAVEIYRKILSQQPDSSITIVSVGFLTNLMNLLLSEPDSFSPLNGQDLVAKKVKSWVAMAGTFPEGKETNVMRDSSASQYVIDNWPTPVVFSGFETGVEVFTGLRLIEEGPEDSPVRMAYAISIPKRAYDKDGRRSWDQTALLVAARGFEPYYGYKTGQFITSPDGSNKWRDDPEGKHRHLVQKMSPDSVAYEIENLMMHRPQKD
ncbi:MAG: nucleoside hydrolase [Bacteroidales bacterium]|nr:nucleoside hydrolase [Bacteroidales bacterium]